MKISAELNSRAEPVLLSKDFDRPNLSEFDQSSSAVDIGDITPAPNPTLMDIDLNALQAQPLAQRLESAASNEPPVSASMQSSTLALLDPKQVRISDIPNRLVPRFAANALRELSDSIFESKGNRTPIEVRRMEGLRPGDVPLYELVAGARRLHVCTQLKLPVLAIVTSAVAPSALSALIENCNRLDLSPYEFGRQLEHALVEMNGLSQNRLALSVGCSASNISRALQIARLPNEVIAAFVDPGEIRFADAGCLTKAIEERAEAVLDEARAISSAAPRPSAKEVVRRLVSASAGGVAPCNAAIRRPLMMNGTPAGEAVFDGRGHAQIRLNLPLTSNERTRLCEQFEAILDKIRRPANRRSPKKAAAGGDGTATEVAASCPSAALPSTHNDSQGQP